MPLADLRYLYHMALVDGMLALSGTSNMCLLWGEMRMYDQVCAVGTHHKTSNWDFL